MSAAPQPPAPGPTAVKVVVLGGSFAGKSCLLNRFANDNFFEGGSGQQTLPTTTLSGAFYSKSVLVGSTRLRLHLWDTAGSEAYHSITRMYYRSACAGILCYDITDYASFTAVQRWLEELASCEPECRLYLCGCKFDMQRDRRQVSVAEARQFADSRDAPFFETSARTGHNVAALFNRICSDAITGDFVSITTGERQQQQPASRFHGNSAGGKKSFALTAGAEARVRSGGGCIQGCSTG